MIDICALDVETSPTDGNFNGCPYALEPWRYKQGKAYITDISIFHIDNTHVHLKNPSNHQIIDELKKIENKPVFMHNAVFDTAWLYAYVGIEPLIKLDIKDTMLLAKWIHNSQTTQYGEWSYSLIDLCKLYLPNHPLINVFINIKENACAQFAGQDEQYWSKRVELDSLMTVALAVELMKVLPGEQVRGFNISQKQIPYVARSWVNGIPFNKKEVDLVSPKIEGGKVKLASALGVTPAVLQSSSQLSSLLFNDWGLKPLHTGKSGKGSTAEGDLKMLALQTQGTQVGAAMNLIMKFRKLQTLQTKYVNGFSRLLPYVGEEVCYGAPKIFGTYTGRYTYSSKTQRKDIFQCSIAMHQLPRLGPAKSWLTAPEGYDIAEWDATGQEIAFMAIASGDVNMINVLNQGMNVHSWMATNFTGDSYDEFIAKLHSDDEDISKAATEIRQSAKLLNLSCQYRISPPALAQKFFDDYDQIITRQQAARYLNIYKSAYPGVVAYWKSTCKEARAKGYAETIGSKRYYLTEWNEHGWQTESSAINTPVQGSGGDQKDLVIWQISENFPELLFALDMHDGLYFFIPKTNQDELKKDVLSFVNKIDYESFWQKDVPVPLRFDGAIGPNFKDKKEYKA